MSQLHCFSFSAHHSCISYSCAHGGHGETEKNEQILISASAGENEANISFVLQKFKNMQLVPQTPHVAGSGLTGQYIHEDGFREEWLLPAQAELVQRFDPCSMSDTIGFFIAKFLKVC